MDEGLKILELKKTNSGEMLRTKGISLLKISKLFLKIL